MISRFKDVQTFNQENNEIDFNEATVRELRDDECPRHTAIGISVEGVAEAEGLVRIRPFTDEEKAQLKCTCGKTKQ